MKGFAESARALLRINKNNHLLSWSSDYEIAFQTLMNGPSNSGIGGVYLKNIDINKKKFWYITVTLYTKLKEWKNQDEGHFYYVQTILPSKG